MLQLLPPRSRRIDRVENKGNGIVLHSEAGMYRLMPMNAATIRITYTRRPDFSARKKPGVTAVADAAGWHCSCGETAVRYASDRLAVLVDRETASCTYYDGTGRELLRERSKESKILEEFQAYQPAEEGSGQILKVETADGVKEVVRDAVRLPGETLYHTRLYLDWKPQEALYGLGQQEEGLLNLRGQVIYVHQANRKIAIPMLVSTEGYGLLMDTYSPMIFHDAADGSYLYTEADDELDYYLIAGDDPDEVIRGYRVLTGKAAMLPKWAFGYLQSQERYESAEELCRVVAEYRRRGIGLDGVVLDWMSWEDGMWGQKTLDPARFPDPAGMVEQLHRQDVHFMVSIWPNMSETCDNYRELKEHGELLPACSVYNALDEAARRRYWQQVSRGLFRFGTDAWWCDSSEPFTPEWERTQRPEPAVLYVDYCREVSDHLPTWAMNAYALFHAQGIYEGQRGEHSGKRVFNLTRSAYTGQQRYGTVMWSGDIAASWKTLRDQIAAGLSFSASGLPYWTVDIGAFFVKKSRPWYCDGEYEETIRDAGYLELFTRWYQWACFLPVFRGHGTDCRRELWLYQGEDDRFYQAILQANRLRYRLMPYIYSQAGRVWLEDASMIRPLAFAYPGDRVAHGIRDQYFFGDSLLVCPVTEPMYYEAGNRKLDGRPHTRRVYLPEGDDWYDYWTNTRFSGGQWIDADAQISKISLFVKAGSLLPLSEPTEHVLMRETIRWVVYGGKDCSYRLYQDEGDGYGYETGDYQATEYRWSESGRFLSDAEGNRVAAELVS